MTRLFSISLFIVSPLFACSTPVRERIDPGAISAYLQKRISIEETREIILGGLEKMIEENKKRQANTSDRLRISSLDGENNVLAKQVGDRRQRLDSQLSGFNPDIDQLWTYQKAGRESGIVLIRKDRVTYLHRLSID
jgi:hypothetical protein